MRKRKPVSVSKLVLYLRASARELAKPYKRRDEDFKDESAVWVLREAAKRLIVMDKKLQLLSVKRT